MELTSKHLCTEIASLDTESSERKLFDPQSVDNLLSDDGTCSGLNVVAREALPKIKPSKSLAKIKLISDALAKNDSGSGKDLRSYISPHHRTPVVGVRKENRFWVRNEKLSLPRIETKLSQSGLLRFNPHPFG